LPDPSPKDRLADRETVAFLDEGDVVDDEDSRLLDSVELLGHDLRARGAVASAVEGPCAAEGAVPGTAPRELDRCARVERADEVLAPVAQQLAGGTELVQAVDEARRRPLSFRGDRPGHGHEPAVLGCFEQESDRGFALALEDAVDGALAMQQQVRSDERGA